MSGTYDRLNDKSKAIKTSAVQSNATKQPSNQATINDMPHEAIRKAVRLVGKETTSYRLSGDEKEALHDLVYAFRKQGLHTNENEIMRIALNLTLTDYADNKDASALVQVLQRLNS